MLLYLVQHGKCHPEEVDPERGLTGEGICDVTRIAETAATYGVSISLIRHSGKKRALQSAEIFKTVTGSLYGIEECSGMNPGDDVRAFAEGISDSNVMLVGHLPFLSRLASYLVTGDPDMPVFRFQNGGIVCLDRNPETGRWVITWALMPHIG